MKTTIILSTLAATAACFTHAADESAAPRPNIVLILADDLGYGDLGCYGAAKIKTPNIDALATGGMRFTDAHASPLCTPTRYSILTGRYPIRNERLANGGVVFPKDPLVVETDRPTLGSFIRDLGYDTGLFGKWHLGFGTGDIDWNGVLRPGPLECGFNTFFGVPTVNSMEPKVFVRDDRIVGLDPKDPIVGRITSSEMKGGAAARYENGMIDVHHADEALAWLRRKRDRPFFLFFPTISIHSPEVPHPDFKGKSEAGLRGDFVVEHDHRVGQILRALDEMGVAENTLVIYASDNGGMDKLGATNPEKSISRQYGHKPNGDWRGMKSDVWEGGHRVPLIVRWPGHVAPGTTSDALVGLNDVFATIADLLGEKTPPEALDSVSFAPVLRSEKGAAGRRFLVALGSQGDYSLRDGHMKFIEGQGSSGISSGKGLIMRRPPEDPSRPPHQLYDLAADPGETTNLFASRPEVAERMRRQLERIRENPAEGSGPQTGTTRQSEPNP